MAKEDEPLIEIENLFHVYKGKVENIALPGISFKVFPREKLAIRGKSGVGKTTLLHCLAGILKTTAGKILVNKQNSLISTKKNLPIIEPLPWDLSINHLILHRFSL